MKQVVREGYFKKIDLDGIPQSMMVLKHQSIIYHNLSAIGPRTTIKNWLAPNWKYHILYKTKKSSTPKTSQAVIGYSDGDEIKGWPRRWLTEQTVMKKV